MAGNETTFQVVARVLLINADTKTDKVNFATLCHAFLFVNFGMKCLVAIRFTSSNITTYFMSNSKIFARVVALLFCLLVCENNR